MGKLVITTENGSTLGNPASGEFYIFIDSNNSNKYTLRDSAGSDTILGGAASGDMLVSTYDPTGVDADAFDYANQIGLTQMPTAQIREYTESGGGSVDFDDYDPTTYNVHFIDPGSHDRDFTGIVAPSAGVNRIVVIINSGTNKKMKFKHNDSGSAAANRIMLADNSDFDLEKGGSVQFIYNHTENRWYTYTYY